MWLRNIERGGRAKGTEKIFKSKNNDDEGIGRKLGEEFIENIELFWKEVQKERGDTKRYEWDNEQ